MSVITLSENVDIIKIYLTITDHKHNRLTVQFICDNDVLEILSSSTGLINGQILTILQKDKTAEIALSKPPCQSIECLLGFYSEEKLISSESIVLSINTPKISLPIPETVNKSKQLIHLDIQDDLVATVKTPINEKINVCLGVYSDTVSSTDFVFKIFPNIKQLIIPKEIFWIIRKNYVIDDTKLTCYELTKSTQHDIRNVFHKKPISNTIDFDVAINTRMDLSDFKTPTNIVLDKKDWKISDVSGLPVQA